MSGTPQAFIVGTGHATPRLTVTSAELEVDLGLEAGWVERRTGVRARRICAPDESCSTLAVDAGSRALEDAGMDPRSIGLVVLATSTPDHPLPPTAPTVARALGADRAGGFDLAGACAGFVYALGAAAAWARGFDRPVLVIAANVLSRRCDPGDPSVRAVFGDGAGAVVVTPRPLDAPAARLDALVVGADARHADAIRVEAGGSVLPATVDAIRDGRHFLRIERGSVVFQEAVRGMVRSSRAALDAAGRTVDEVDAWIPHQANHRILARVQSQLGLREGSAVDVLAEWGNSSAASIPTAVSLFDRERAPWRTMLLSAVGAGMLEAAAVLTRIDPSESA